MSDANTPPISTLSKRFLRMAQGLMPPFIWSSLRKVTFLMNEGGRQRLREEQILRGLDTSPEMSPCVVKLRGSQLSGVDGRALANLYRENFHQEQLKFHTASVRPLILDCGANIGIVTLYMKSLFPDARIVAFEPDPESYAALEKNCQGLSGIRTISSAVWTATEELSFVPAGAVGGHLAHLSGGKEDSSVKVSAVRLRDYLTEPVDLLKLDIEGSEVDVLADCADRLDLVERMFVEFHSFEGMPQRFGELLRIIENAGFRIHLHGSMEEPQPFLGINVYNRKDLRANLFCYRSS